MKLLRLALIIGSSLALATSCTGLVPLDPSLEIKRSFTVNVRGHAITAHVYEGHDRAGERHSGIARPGENGCTVYVRQSQFEGFTASSVDSAHLLAHEVGHCLDWLELGFDHNDWDARGETLFGSSKFAKPSEGYAEAFAFAYLNSCGATIKPLLENGECVPMARAIK